LFYSERYSQTELGTHDAHQAGALTGSRQRIPDFVKLADALGCIGLRCETKAEVDATIEKAMSIDDQPVVVDFTVGKDAMVWPMVAAGTSNDEIIAARGIRPNFDSGV
jgi:acetolactate synthase-1/2/3 large subunit